MGKENRANQRFNDPSLEVEINREESGSSLFQSAIALRYIPTPGDDVSPVSRALGWPGASRPGKGQLSTRCQSTPPRASTSGTVGIRPVGLGAGSRALRQYSRAPRQETVSRPRALDGACRRSAIYVLDRPARHRDTRSCTRSFPSLFLRLGFRVCISDRPVH